MWAIFTNRVVSFFMSSLLTLLSSLNLSCSGYNDLPSEPDDFEPIVRFTVASDVHVNAKVENQIEAKRLAEMIKASYKIANESEQYKALDAVVFAGDITDKGDEDSFRLFKKICDDNLKGETLLLPMLGNHDYGNLGEETRDVFNSIFDYGCDFDVNINGVHIMASSKLGKNKNRDLKTLNMINNQIKAAKSENPQAPIFFVQHEHIFNTVYGSIHWGDPMLKGLLAQHPQIINFSGHSHYPINDPRSIWQGTFTALGCGTLSYFEMEKNGVSGQFPENNREAAQMYVVEVNKESSVRIRCYDLITGSFFGETYYIETPSDATSFAYTYKNRKMLENLPAFDDDAAITTSLLENGTTLITFDKAQGCVIPEYEISVKKYGVFTVYEETFIPDYYLVNSSSTGKVNVGSLESGKKYTVSITAQNAYGQGSEPIVYSFVAQ